MALFLLETVDILGMGQLVLILQNPWCGKQALVIRRSDLDGKINRHQKNLPRKET
jgi:hypothetical protein